MSTLRVLTSNLRVLTSNCKFGRSMKKQLILTQVTSHKDCLCHHGQFKSKSSVSESVSQCQCHLFSCSGQLKIITMMSTWLVWWWWWWLRRWWPDVGFGLRQFNLEVNPLVTGYRSCTSHGMHSMFRNLVLGVWPPKFMQYWNQNFIQDNYYKLDLIHRSQVSLFNFSILNLYDWM